jgi:hypothetical protein
VRFDTNDYSVPTAYAHHELLVKGYVDRVEVCCADQVIACHDRCWGRDEYCLEPLHYLALLERQPGAWDYGRPFADWDLPECFAVLRARLEQQWPGGVGTWEFIGVLQLLAGHSVAELARGLERALRHSALIRDAVAQFLIPPEDPRLTTFTLDGREHLRQVQVAQTAVAAYADLLPGGGAL